MNIRDVPARHVFTFLSFCGLFNIFALRVNMSVAVVAMVREPYGAQDLLGGQDKETCTELEGGNLLNSTFSSNQSISVKGEFNWDSNTRGQVLASFFYGYVLTQIPGGVLADKYSAKWLFGIGMLLASICTLLTPVAARWSLYALIITRVIAGLGAGMVFPSSWALIGRWAPKMERSQMTTYVTLGVTLGNAASFIISGVLCEAEFLGGWPSAFYVFGTIGCVWFILWTWFVYDSPETHPRISKKESAYICREQDRGEITKPQIPWRYILTSIPAWALVFTQICHMCGFYVFLTELPSYLSHVLHFNLRNNGVLSALPQLMFSLNSILAGIAADKLRKRGTFRITAIRKIFNSVGFFGAAACLLVVAYAGCRPVLIVALLTLAMSLLGYSMSGFSATYVDMSPDFSGVLFGISNALAASCGFLVPVYVGWIMQDGQTLRRWSIVFTTSSALYMVSGFVYNVFCTSEHQRWSKSSSPPTDGGVVGATEMIKCNIPNEPGNKI